MCNLMANVSHICEEADKNKTHLEYKDIAS
jgi:hypothetical protein